MSFSLTDDEKDRIAMLIRKEISEIEAVRYRTQMILDINKEKPQLEDEAKEQKRQDLIETYEKITQFFTQDIELLESIQNKLTVDV